MVGIINGRRMFEYRTEDELVAALDFYASKYGDNNVIIITNAQDQVLITIVDENYQTISSLSPETDYYMRMYTYNGKLNDLDLPGKNDKLSGKYLTDEFHKIRVYECIRKTIQFD